MSLIKEGTWRRNYKENVGDKVFFRTIDEDDGINPIEKKKSK